jgi:folylpolyglutamate synthase/dihydropteroate synthase
MEASSPASPRPRGITQPHLTFAFYSSPFYRTEPFGSNNGLTFAPRLLGDHQRRNAESALAVLFALQQGPPCEARAAALAAATVAPATASAATVADARASRAWRFRAKSIAAGFATARLPGRFELLCQAGQPAAPVLVADGAHTAGSGAALARALQSLQGRLALVLAAASDKPHAALFQPLAALRPCAVVCTQVAVAGGAARSADEHALAAAWLAAEAAACVSSGATLTTVARGESLSGLRDAIIAALRAAGDGGVVCVTGSLHAAFAAVELARSGRLGEGGKWSDALSAAESRAVCARAADLPPTQSSTAG